MVHPFDPLSAAEISLVSKIVKDEYVDQNVILRVVTLSEPAKTGIMPYLEAENASMPLPRPPPRCALVQYYLDSINNFWEAQVGIDAGKILNREHLAGRHSYTDAVEMQRAEVACLADPRIQAELKAMELPEDAVVCVEPWTYAPDGMEDMTKRFVMCYFYMRIGSHLDSNHYAYPLDLCAEMSGDREVLKIIRLPSRDAERADFEAAGKSRKFDRRKIHTTSEYHPDLVGKTRDTTKPYIVRQPEGPSFSTQGNLLTWEKWRLRVGFNYREGLTLHDISYDGRKLFYRLSLSEMFVPYGDGRAPYPRKAAFDLGSDGAGVNANNLQLGCDCLGHIKYFDTYSHTTAGDPIKVPNVVCCHEIDDGILWKHTNYRTGNAVVARARTLVLQTIITVSNYEYIFAFHLNQAGAVSYEVRATGILSTSPIDIGHSVPYGQVVAPGVMAPYHQHLFSLRIDPAIDGFKNSLAVEESNAMPLDDPKVHNPFGVGYTTTQTVSETEGALDLDISKGRVFKILNESVLNPINGLPVGYQLVPHPSQMLLAHPSSFHAKRSEFGAHALWVTRYRDGELYAGGKHTMQSAGGEGISSWIQERKEKAEETGVRNEDIVIWHTFGTTHNPRIEDWPVMPCEKMLVTLKPVNFFGGNPGIDVKGSRQEDNKSVLVEDEACCAVKSVRPNL
ncbi:Copper amine oxidase 1 [Hyphodiscus hymeniophilus]|uniref:Amine oxidase n=1 Tax=Hyphodiscus hymeniophilus TaxID=353542 RepID=A0A9P6VMQ3_9HELO|nr:Copper amine oxidase 1 [Hyphodiscus hymeniophilus]